MKTGAMRARRRVVLRGAQRPGGDRAAIEVRYEPDATAGELNAAVRRSLGIELAVPERLAPSTPLDSLGLRRGQALADALRRGGGPIARSVVVTEASGTSHVVGLPVGEHIIGRDPAAQIPLRDLKLSRRHALITVSSSGEVAIEDCGSLNGTTVDGQPLHATTNLLPGAVVRVGDCTIVLLERPAISSALIGPVDGWMTFNRPPRPRVSFASTVVELPDPPARAESARLPLASSLVPLVLGLGALALSRSMGSGQSSMQVLSVVFLLAAPLMAVTSYLETKRGDRGRLRSRSTAFRQEVDRLRAQATEFASTYGERLGELFPAPTVVVADAIGPTAALWRRRPQDDDHLGFRLGVGRVRAPITVKARQPSDAEADIEASSWLASAPVVGSLSGGHLALVGPPSETTDLLRWIVAQLVVYQSPADLRLLPVDLDDDVLGQLMSWLPHVDAEMSFRTEVWRDLVDGWQAERTPGLREAGQPTVVAIAGMRSATNPYARMVLAEGIARGVRVIWVTDNDHSVPGGIDTVADVRGGGVALEHVGSPPAEVLGDRCSEVDFERVALALASLRDASASAQGRSLPTSVNLLELMTSAGSLESDIEQQWALPRASLKAMLGVGEQGPLEIDLRHDGPHGLIAGTTGAGKSELLQTLVTSLALRYSPRHLNFMLIDYKGGAAFKDCVDLPHTAGFVTDLDAGSAVRALRSLRAELRRREHLLAASGSKDITEFERQDADAPANLVIIIDEFAVMRRELPDFVSGVIDIAQRGRSLGVHLLLATQSPSGIVDDQIRANTNLRVALRVNTSQDSRDVIDDPSAALLPQRIAGRAIVRVGMDAPRMAQVAYVGGRFDETGGAKVEVVELGADLLPRLLASEASSETAATDLQRVTAAAQRVCERAGGLRAASLWLPPLPAAVSLDRLGRHGVPWALVDEPDVQRQSVASWPSITGISLLCVGSDGSGRSTAVRTIAASAILSDDSAEVYAIDAGGGSLRDMAAEPHVGAVVEVRERERLEQLLNWLLDQIEAASAGQFGPPRLLVVHGYHSFVAELQDADHGNYVEQLHRIVAGASGAGIGVVVTAPRRTGIPATITSAVKATAVLPLADDDEYAALGLYGHAKSATNIPGRAWLGDNAVQIAYVGNGSGPDEQAQWWSDRRSAPTRSSPRAIRGLPSGVSRHQLAEMGIDGIGVLGRVGDGWTPERGDLRSMLITGPDGCGKSTVLSTVVGWVREQEDRQVIVLAPRGVSPNLQLGATDEVMESIDACQQRVVELAGELRSSDAANPRARLLVVDDGEELLDPLISSQIENVLKLGRDRNLLVVAAALAYSVHRAFGGWTSELRKARSGLLLQPDPLVDGEIFGVRLPVRNAVRFPPGRGYLVRRGTTEIVQVAKP